MAVESYMPYFQPQVDMRSGELIGAEALARGIDDKGRVLLPEVFERKLMKEGGRDDLETQILHRVFCQLRDWKKRGFFLPMVSVSISPETLSGAGTFAAVYFLVNTHNDVPADRIGLKVKRARRNPNLRQNVDGNLRLLYQRGLRLELLHNIPEEPDFFFNGLSIHTLKLDKSLTEKAEEGKEGEESIREICQWCREYRIRCIAEGVDTETQAEALMDAGCFYGQGRYFSRPLSVKKFEKRYMKGAEYSGR